MKTREREGYNSKAKEVTAMYVIYVLYIYIYKNKFMQYVNGGRFLKDEFWLTCCIMSVFFSGGNIVVGWWK